MMSKKLFFLTFFATVVSLALASGAKAADPNLVGWWPLDDGSGDIAIDLSGNGNDGTINNPNGGLGTDGSVWIDDPQRGTVISFNGTAEGAFVRAGEIPQMTLTNDFTWAFWAKQKAENTTDNDIILGNRMDENAVDFVPRQFIKFTPTKFEWHMNGNPDDNLEYDDIPADVWLHHAVVKTADQLTYYRNGVEHSSGTITQALDFPQPLFFGGDNEGSSGENWNGLMSDVRIYNRALTGLEIATVLADLEIGYASQTPVIDGQVDKIWESVSTQNFVPLEDPNDGSGIWKALYDAENLYVMMEITDANLVNDSADSWLDDSVEIYFDGGNTKLSTALSGDDHQYTFGWTTDEIQGNNIAGYIEGIEHAQVDTDTGWRIEVKMPWMSIWGVVPQAGDLIGIDCYYNDDDDGGDSREGKMLGFSTIEGWNDASQWGSAVLNEIPPGATDPNPSDGATGLSPKLPLSTYISGDVPKSIPDCGVTASTIYSSLTVADSLKITDLNVELDIRHSNNSDLNVYLIGPDGTQVELFTDVGLWNKNFKNTILDDEAVKSITSGSEPFTGIFKPEGKLSALDGKNAKGTWKLKIQDDWASGTGTLNSWRLVIESPNTIKWSPAAGIASQELYISDNFDDVFNSAASAYQGNLAGDTSSIEIDLDLGQTYFWRIDSLNEDNMLIGIGDIWSFSTVDVNDTTEAASNPVPADGAIEVVQDTILKWWHGLSAVSSDVYFGTNSSPAFMTTTTGTSFDVGKLATSTTYYWQIDETDADGNLQTGVVWSFTTVIGEATEPNPADLASDVPVDTILSWKAGGTAASYDVYFGTTDSPEFMCNQVETSFDPGGLAYAAMYYWQVDAVEADGTTHVGALWSFTTPSGQATNPDPVDGAIVGTSSMILSWTAGDGAALHDVYLGTDLNALEYQDRQTGTDIMVDGLAPETTYYWQIIEVEGDGITVHESPVWSFTVAPLTAYDPSPADGEELASDAIVVLSWKAGLDAEQHAVYLGFDPNAVANAKGAIPRPDTTFDLEPLGLLEAGKTFYWRIDEVVGTEIVKGDVWSFSLAALEPEPEPEPEPKLNLLDLVVQLNTEGDLAGTFDTLIAAVLVADLADALGSEDNLTVFSPSDDAFAELGLTPENVAQVDSAFLTDLLLYHATAGRLLATDVLAVDHLEMLNGGNVNQLVGVLTDHLGRESKITITDLEASNGVIHVIDSVLLPNELPELGPEPEPVP